MQQFCERKKGKSNEKAVLQSASLVPKHCQIQSALGKKGKLKRQNFTRTQLHIIFSSIVTKNDNDLALQSCL